MLDLVPVTAYYRDPETGTIRPLRVDNALAAADFALKWEHFRQLANAQGWELLIAPPAAGTDYTRGFFRTPQDQAALISEGAPAASVDGSSHQAGRAADIDLGGMAATYPDFSYTRLTELAERSGIFARLSDEPWHFDDNPRSIFGSTYAAVQQIGNLFDQVQAAIAAGMDTPQIAAVKKAVNENKWILGLGVLVGAVLLLKAQENRQEKKYARDY